MSEKMTTIGKGIRLKNGTMYLDFTYRGCRQREALDLPYTATNLKTAKKLLADIQAVCKIDKYVRSDWFDKEQKTGTTFKAFSTTWLSTLPLQSRTLRAYTSGLNTLYKDFGTKELKDIKPLDIQKWMKSSMLSPKSIRNYCGIISAVFKAAIANELVVSNPMEHVTLPKKKDSEDSINPYTVGELDKLFTYLHENEPELCSLAKFMYQTGLRPSEAFCLQYKDLNIKDSFVRVYRSLDSVKGATEPSFKPPKNGKTRIVSLTQDAIDAVDALSTTPLAKRFANSFVFLNPRTGKIWNGAHLNSKLWKNSVRKAEVPAKPLYAMRHSFGCHLVSEGYPMKYVSQQLGHSNTVITEQHYSRFMQSATDEVLKLRNKKKPHLKVVSK